jgi:hypothetical protein
MALSAVIASAGVIWVLIASGAMRRREVSAEEAAEILAGRDDDEHGITTSVKEKSVFVGKSVGVSGNLSISIDELATAIRNGQWGEVAPWLLVIAGFVGVLLLSVPLVWLIAGPWAGAGWFVLLLVSIIRNSRSREKKER